MMTKPLLAILLLLPLSVSAGELDGKGLICELIGRKVLDPSYEPPPPQLVCHRHCGAEEDSVEQRSIVVAF